MEIKVWYHLKWGLLHIPPFLIQFRQEQKGLKHQSSKQQLFGGFARRAWIMQHNYRGGQQCKIECGWAAGRCSDSAPSPSTEILKSYNNEVVSPRSNLKEHSTCSPTDWNLSWVPPRNQDPPLATDRGKEASYWTAGETCKKRSQKEKTVFPRKLTAAVSTALMRTGELTAPETQLLPPFSQYTHVITAHTSSQYIFHQS